MQCARERFRQEFKGEFEKKETRNSEKGIPGRKMISAVKKAGADFYDYWRDASHSATASAEPPSVLISSS